MQVTYFFARGRAELCRLLLIAGGIAFEDERVEHEVAFVSVSLLSGVLFCFRPPPPLPFFLFFLSFFLSFFFVSGLQQVEGRGVSPVRPVANLNSRWQVNS